MGDRQQRAHWPHEQIYLVGSFFRKKLEKILERGFFGRMKIIILQNLVNKKNSSFASSPHAYYA